MFYKKSKSVFFVGSALLASSAKNVSSFTTVNFLKKSANANGFLKGESLVKNNIPVGMITSTKSTTSLFANKFDLSKPTFDLFSLRTVRNDALLQYSSLNQSEPLRINLFLILAASLFSFPTLSEAVIGEQAQLPSIVISTLGGFGSVALFVKECQNRMKQLNRIEKELNSESLQIKLSTSNKFDESIFGKQQSFSLKYLKGKKRILAICGSKDQLKDAVLMCRIFRRRLAQAGVIVAIVPTDLNSQSAHDDGPSMKDFKELGIQESEIRSGQWLGQVQLNQVWKDYCQGLVDDNNILNGERDLIWFGLNYNGRSFASARGESPRLLEILGQNLRPVDYLDEDDENEANLGLSPADLAMVKDISQRQADFYNALTKGNLGAMNEICSLNQAREVTEILDVGGRIDSWESCLADGARPADMTISSSDVLVVSSTEAYSTCIEFPVMDTGGFGNSDTSDATLLAVQKWTRADDSQDWALTLHQTIPWSPDTRAGGTLRCDRRGCVALTRGKERRTFGGIIG